MKAKAAYVLGYTNLEILGKPEIAEQLFFECAYILDTLTPLTTEMPAIISGIAIRLNL